MNIIKVNPEKCTRCGTCVRDCIVEVLKPGADAVPCVRAEEEIFCLNCQHCLAVCPAGALTCHGVSPDDCNPIGLLPEPELMLNLLRQRRSIRQYKNENLDNLILDKLTDSLAWSPTGCNDHSLFFTVIREKSEMDFFRSSMGRMLRFLIRTGIMRLIYPGFKRYFAEIMNGKDVVFRNAPHMIVAAIPRNAPCKEADPWIALSYFDLYAQSLGVGTCWCGFAVHAFKWNWSLRRRLNIPKAYKIGAVLLFGKPDVKYARASSPEQFSVFSSKNS